MKKKQVHQLSVLISLLLGELTKGDRQKIMTICTIDVHSRDVVLKLIQAKLESASAFQWQSQLRHRWDDDENDCFANICDAQFRYCYEYLGNTPRLVITPLTDRCYITLTQSLHLVIYWISLSPVYFACLFFFCFVSCRWWAEVRLVWNVSKFKFILNFVLCCANANHPNNNIPNTIFQVPLEPAKRRLLKIWVVRLALWSMCLSEVIEPVTKIKYIQVVFFFLLVARSKWITK